MVLASSSTVNVTRESRSYSVRSETRPRIVTPVTPGIAWVWPGVRSPRPTSLPPSATSGVRTVGIVLTNSTWLVW